MDDCLAVIRQGFLWGLTTGFVSFLLGISMRYIRRFFTL